DHDGRPRPHGPASPALTHHPPADSSCAVRRHFRPLTTHDHGRRCAVERWRRLYAKPTPAASSATQLNPAAASTEGPEPTDWAWSACWPAASGRDGAGVGAGGGRGPTSVPTGLTFPSTAKPQFSRLLPA